MINFERIKNMSISEMTDFILDLIPDCMESNTNFTQCPCFSGCDCYRGDEECLKNFKKWLEREENND